MAQSAHVRLLARQVGAALLPDERVQHAVRATSGPRGTTILGRLSAEGGLRSYFPIPFVAVAHLLGVRNYLVVVSDVGVTLVRRGLARTRPVEVVARLPRPTRLGPFTGNGWIVVAGITMYVWEVEDLREVQRADAEIGYDTPGPPVLWWAGPGR